MGGGPSAAQEAAATSQAQTSAQEAQIAQAQLDRQNQIYNKWIEPFASSRIENGLPFYDALSDYSGGLNARAFAPARARILERYSQMGDLPSGAREQAMSDFEANRARAFDSSLANNLLLNEQAKQEAGRLLTGQQQIANPLGYYTAANQGFASIMNAPLQEPPLGGMGGMLGGAIGGALSFF